MSRMTGKYSSEDRLAQRSRSFLISAGSRPAASSRICSKRSSRASRTFSASSAPCWGMRPRSSSRTCSHRNSSDRKGVRSPLRKEVHLLLVLVVPGAEPAGFLPQAEQQEARDHRVDELVRGEAERQARRLGREKFVEPLLDSRARVDRLRQRDELLDHGDPLEHVDLAPGREGDDVRLPCPLELVERLLVEGLGLVLLLALDRVRAWPGRLLHHVRQLVGEQLASRGGAGRVLVRTQHDVVPGREGARVQRLGQAGGVRVGVHPHLAEVMAEARLHERPRGGIQRLAGRKDRRAPGRGGGALQRLRDRSRHLRHRFQPLRESVGLVLRSLRARGLGPRRVGRGWLVGLPRFRCAGPHHSHSFWNRRPDAMRLPLVRQNAGRGTFPSAGKA